MRSPKGQAPKGSGAGLAPESKDAPRVKRAKHQTERSEQLKNEVPLKVFCTYAREKNERFAARKMYYRCMIDAKHAQMVSLLAKPGYEIQSTLTDKKCHLLHMAVGIAGEAGELLDAVKKHVIYGKELDLENVIEELGDLEFYMQGLREKLEIARELTLEKNIAKLSVRYKNGYSDSAAQIRADKQ
jgi:NTP pyrophosphatase (non-canonical NTP hydrolase)